VFVPLSRRGHSPVTGTADADAVTVALQSLPSVPTAIRRRRRLRLARTVVGHSVRARLLPAGERRRQRLQVCGAADTLTALGVRVQVLAPATPWPRTGRFVISDHVGRLGDLAVSTAFRGPTDGGDVICPVAVRYRVEGRPGYLPAHQVPRRTAAIVAMHGLVVEVHCLPAIHEPGA
jgi:hypothetical protein